MTANPIDIVIVDGVAVSKSDLRGYEKLRVRKYMADPDEVRNTSLSGQYAGIYIRSLQKFFDLDTSDTTTADDGAVCIIDDDGNRFKVVATGGFTSRVETTVGDVSLLDDDSYVSLQPASAQPRTITLPDSGDVSGPIIVGDDKGYWSDVNYTRFVVDGGKTLSGQANWDGTTANGGFTFIPISGGNYRVQ